MLENEGKEVDEENELRKVRGKQQTHSLEMSLTQIFYRTTP